MKTGNRLHNSLQDRVAVVSGATGGMGSAICARLACAGATVIMLGRDDAKLQRTRESLATKWGIGERLATRVVDIGNAQSVDETVTEIVEAHEQIDILVHAAGDGPVAPLLETTEVMWNETIQGKLLGTVRLTRAVAANMALYRHGRIVIVNGAFSREPDPLFSVNSTVNAGLAGFGKSAARDLGRLGIRVNVVNPGATTTPLWNRICHDLSQRFGISADDVDSQAREKIPLGVLASPEDIGEVVAFLASPASHYLNGASISVDGGATACI